MDLGGSRRDETAAANIILAFAAGVVAAPNFSDPTAEDAPDEFERIVAIIAAQIAGLPLSLPALARIASGLEPFRCGLGGARSGIAPELPGPLRPAFRGRGFGSGRGDSRPRAEHASRNACRFERPPQAIRDGIGRGAGSSRSNPGIAGAGYRHSPERAETSLFILRQTRWQGPQRGGVLTGHVTGYLAPRILIRRSFNCISAP